MIPWGLEERCFDELMVWKFSAFDFLEASFCTRCDVADRKGPDWIGFCSWRKRRDSRSSRDEKSDGDYVTDTHHPRDSTHVLSVKAFFVLSHHKRVEEKSGTIICIVHTLINVRHNLPLEAFSGVPDGSHKIHNRLFFRERFSYFPLFLWLETEPTHR